MPMKLAGMFVITKCDIHVICDKIWCDMCLKYYCTCQIMIPTCIGFRLCLYNDYSS